MKGRILLCLFALPFFGVGAWMGYSIAGHLNDAWRMQDWIPVAATLTRAGYESHADDDGTTYEAYAQYTYTYEGRVYVGERVAIAVGADNIGDFQQELGARLSAAMARRETVTVYVNPALPSEAIIDRSLRWGLLGFKSIFFFVFGGFGLGLLIFVFRAPKKKDPSAPELTGRPWLVNDDWQTATIRSSSKMAMWAAWGFAAFWNLISAPLPFVVHRELVGNGNALALIGLLFPIVGVGLVVWAVRRTREWRRFGPAPVTLDPFPGAIGGHVGGTIDVNLPYDPSAKFSLTLTNVRSYVSGSGKKRRRRESAEWQDAQVAHATSGARGTRLSFRFDVPPGLAESDADQSEDSYHLWRLGLQAELPGADIDRDYEIPVYATGEESSQLSGYAIEEAKSEQGRLDLDAIQEIVNLTHSAAGKSLYYPVGRNLLGGLMGLVVGSIFAIAGWFLTIHEGHTFFGGVFGLVGLLVALSSLYVALNSLEVVKQGSEIRTVRRILGIPVSRRRMKIADFFRFRKSASSKSQSGSKHTIRYTIAAVDRSGEKLTLGEGFKGAGQAKAAMEFFSRELGLTPAKNEPEPDASYADADFLAAD